MFCPKCGDHLTDVDGEMTCIAGDMGLSKWLFSALTDLCGDPPQVDRSTRVRWGGGWHCPLDGSLMSSSDTELPTCPECQRVLPSRVVYQLIELHPHR
jgi:hypothetical protein